MPRNNAPFGPRAVTKAFPDTEPTQVYDGVITTSFFVAAEKPPQVKTLVRLREAITDNAVRTYEISLHMVGLHLLSRVYPPPMKGTKVTSSGGAPAHHPLTAPFKPPHLHFVLKPPPVPPPRRRRGPRRRRRPTTTPLGVFPPDNRTMFDVTAYPWSAFGRCRAESSFSGVMVGPRHLLTCSHGINWTAPAGFNADWLTFTPDTFSGSKPFGSTYGEHVYYHRRVGEDPSQPDDVQFDYVVVVLHDRIGEATGWFGVRTYDNAWDSSPVWWHAGYPYDSPYLSTRPTYEDKIVLDGDDTHPNEHKAISHRADTPVGHSGGPMFGYWAGEPGPRTVAVQSHSGSSANDASGGGDLVDLVIRARTDFP